MRCYQREFDSSLDSGAGLCVAPAGWTLCRPLPLLWNLELKPCVTRSLQAHGWQSRIIVLLTRKLFTCSRALYLNSQDTFRRSFIHSSPPFWSWTLCRSHGLDCVSPVPSSLESGGKTLCRPFPPFHFICSESPTRRYVVLLCAVFQLTGCHQRKLHSSL